MSLKISCNFFCTSRDYEQERRYSGQILQSSEAQKCLVKGFDNKINVKGNLPCFQRKMNLKSCVLPTSNIRAHQKKVHDTLLLETEPVAHKKNMILHQNMLSKLLSHVIQLKIIVT